MLFNVEVDKGDVIRGYLVPDGFSEQPSIRIVVEGRPDIVCDCDGIRDAVVASGRHETGLIGFNIDRGVIRDLPRLRHLSIYDHKTGLLVYRRIPAKGLINKRMLRLETQLIPFSKLDGMLDPHFQYAIRGVEAFGHETAMQAFHLNALKSIYISGRLLIRNYEEFLEKGFEVIGQIADPYEEMAERLLLFKRFGSLPRGLLGDRDRIIFAPAAEHFSSVDLRSPKVLKRSLQTAEEQVQRALHSPLTRQLVATHPDFMATRLSVAPAMDMLSRFTVVGLKDRPDSFIDPLAEFLNLPASSVPTPSVYPAAKELASILRGIPAAERLIEFDLILYHFAKQAIALHHDVGTDHEPGMPRASIMGLNDG